MDATQTLNAIKKAVIAAQFTEVDTTGDGFMARRGGNTPASIVVQQDTIAEFLSTTSIRDTTRPSPTATAFITDSTYEQLLESTNDRVLISGAASRTYKFGSTDDGSIEVIISTPTPEFRHHFTMIKEAFQSITNRFARSYLSPMTLESIFSKMATVQVKGVKSLLDAGNIKEVALIANDCLFELSYLKGRNLELRDTWYSDLLRERPFRQFRYAAGQEFAFKGVRYNPTITRFYKRAIAARDPYIEFLSFYHVLEYFFVSVSDEILYSRIKAITADPLYRSKRASIENIVSAVEDHNRTSDETEMLKNVINKFIDETDIVNFIKALESEKGKTYTERSECFGQELTKITIKDGHIIGPISKRIKQIRNVLVHSSDRHERRERYVPGPDANVLLQRELPLLRFLAERVIIASATTD